MKAPLPAPATLTETIERLAAAKPDDIAILYEGDSITYAALLERSKRVAGALADLGVGPGDRVAMWLPAVPAWLIAYFALCRLGATAAAVNTRFRSSEAEDILRRSGAKTVILWRDFKHIDFVGILAEIDGGALADLETVILYDEEDAGGAPAPILGRRTVRYRDLERHAPLEADAAGPELPCNIVTTSGTTKAPKLVLHKQAAIAGHVWRAAYAFGYAVPGTKVLQPLPFCGVFGLDHGLAALCGGATLVIMSAFDGARAAELIRSLGIHHMNGADEMFYRMFEAVEGDDPFPSLRECGYAAFAGTPDEIAQAAAKRNVRLFGLYGMSEIQGLLSLQPAESDPAQRFRPGGFPIWDEAEVRVRDRDTDELLPPGRAGELEVKTPSLMVGYLDNPEATREAVTEDGFMRTGDLGELCADGGFVYLNRMGDALRLGGFLVSPLEIESYIEGHPDIAGVQAIGVPRERGVFLCAFVTLAPGAAFDEAALRAYCRDGMAGYKVPERFVPLDAFPVTLSANGTKIQRTKLRDMAEAFMTEQAVSA